MNDLGGLDDILDDDIGYVPTGMRQKPKGRMLGMSRQNSTQSIGSVKDTKEEDNKNLFGNNKLSNQGFFGTNKEQPKNNSSTVEKDISRQSGGRRNTLFGAHKETATMAQNGNPQGSPISFEDFFRNQNVAVLSSKPPLPQKKVEKMVSINQLQSPENILQDELNNSSMASRRGRPPLSQRKQNNQSEIQQNRSQNFATSKGFGSPNNDTRPVPVVPVVPQTNQPSVKASENQALMNESIEDLKKMLSSQLQYQKQAFENLIKQQRESHENEIQKLKQFHSEEMKKKLQIKQFELEKVKEFYQLQLKIHKERNLEVKDYSSISKKLEGNIETIEKLEKNFKDTEFQNRKQKDEEKRQVFERKENQLKQKEKELRQLMTQLESEKVELRNEKISLSSSVNTQKSRLYELQLELRKRQAELQVKYKKLQAKLVEEYETKSKNFQTQQEELRMESLRIQQQRNIIEVQKLEVINSRKLWDNEKKAYLQQLHQQKTKVLQKEIEIASRTGQIQIKEQEIQMHQNDYINKLKLIELEKKKIEIEKSNSKGQFYLNATSGTFKTNGLLGTTLLSKSNQLALHKEFYSNDESENGPFNQESNYKKSITQMRDDFLKSLPKF